MTTSLARNSDRQLAHSLDEIPPLIKERLQRIDSEQRNFDEMTLPDKQEIGNLLIEAKAQLKHGEWGPWLRKNFKWSQSTAWKYGTFATHSPDKFSRKNMPKTMVEVLREHSNSFRDRTPEWKEDVREQMKRAQQELLEFQKYERSQREERDAERKLGLRLINIGYKILAAELHPDVGGKHELMRRLNAVRNRLKEAA